MNKSIKNTESSKLSQSDRQWAWGKYIEGEYQKKDISFEQFLSRGLISAK